MVLYEGIHAILSAYWRRRCHPQPEVSPKWNNRNHQAVRLHLWVTSAGTTDTRHNWIDFHRWLMSIKCRFALRDSFAWLAAQTFDWHRQGNIMAVSNMHQQLCAGSVSPDTSGVYNCSGAGLSPFDELAACLEVGNLYTRHDSFDGLAATAVDAQYMQRSSHVSLRPTTRPLIIYPWMKQRRPALRNGNHLFYLFQKNSKRFSVK